MRWPATSSDKLERAAAARPSGRGWHRGVSDERQRPSGEQHVVRGARPREAAAARSEYPDAEGTCSCCAARSRRRARAEYARGARSAARQREDAWQRATELLFERLAVSWTIAGVRLERQKELLGRYRMASAAERGRSCRDALCGQARVPSDFPVSVRGAVIDPGRICACADLRLVPGGRSPASRSSSTTSTLAQAPALALHRALLERGAWPLLRLSPPELASISFATPSREQLDGFAPLELLEAREADASVAGSTRPPTRAHSPGSTRSWSCAAARASHPIQEARLARRWCGTIWPTPALAQQAGMSERDYAAFVRGALFLDRRRSGRRLARAEPAAGGAGARGCSGAREVRIEAEGTDLSLRVDGRTWINSDGRRNMPSGEVFTGPLEDSATGTIRFDVPSVVRGEVVSGVELTFEAGRVVALRGRARRRAPRRRPCDRRPARASSASSGSARTPGSIARPARRCSTRRSRDRAPRAGALVSRDRGHERLGIALGSDLRPPSGRAIDRRRRGLDSLGGVCRVTSRVQMRRTKIVATIGPASREPEVLTRMVQAGLDVARLDFSQGKPRAPCRKRRTDPGSGRRSWSPGRDPPGPAGSADCGSVRSRAVSSS